MPLETNSYRIDIPFSKGYCYANPQIIYKRVI